MEYELITIKDIFEKIPLTKIKTCMGELTELLIQCKSIESGIKSIAENMGVADSAFTKWPEPITWIDDGKGDITITAELNGQHIGTIETKVPPCK